MALATLLYIATAADRALKGDASGAVIWGGYSVANVGFMLAYWGRWWTHWTHTGPTDALVVTT